MTEFERKLAEIRARPEPATAADAYQNLADLADLVDEPGSPFVSKDAAMLFRRAGMRFHAEAHDLREEAANDR